MPTIPKCVTNQQSPVSHSQPAMNTLIIKKKPVKFNSVHNVIHKTFAVFGCPKVACSRDGARDFFCDSPVNNALSPSRADANETVYIISSVSRDTLSTNETHEKENFGDWYIIIIYLTTPLFSA